MNFRTDRNNNPTAFTTALAESARLELNKDYIVGDQFNVGTIAYHTAKLIGNPIDITIKLIDKIGFYTQHGVIRWTYIGIPKFIWDSLNIDQKKLVIKFMYHREGGTELEHLFKQ